MILGTIAAKWEQIDKEPHGLAVSPFVLTTAAPTLADVSWDPEDARGAVRDFLSDPRDSNITGLENFLKMICTNSGLVGVGTALLRSLHVMTAKKKL